MNENIGLHELDRNCDNLSPKKRKLVGAVETPNKYDKRALQKSSLGHPSPTPKSNTTDLRTSPRYRIEKATPIDKRRRINDRNLSPPSSPKNYYFLAPVRIWCTKWEVARKLLHTSIGFITLHQWIKGTTSPVKITNGLAKALVVIVSADLLRFRSARFARFYESLLGFLMRPSEKNRWNGVIFYLIGVIISLSTLPLDISVLSILTLSWVDTAASIIGRLYGSEANRLPSPPFARQKSIAGFLGALTIGTATAFTFWSTWAPQGLTGAEGCSWQGASKFHRPGQYRELFDQSLLSSLIRHIQLPNPRSKLGLGSLSFACGLVGAFAESFDLFGWDDNLVLPILSGWGIWGLMRYFGWIQSLASFLSFISFFKNFIIYITATPCWLSPNHVESNNYHLETVNQIYTVYRKVDQPTLHHCMVMPPPQSLWFICHIFAETWSVIHEEEPTKSLYLSPYRNIFFLLVFLVCEFYLHDFQIIPT